jgi:hypothetical protein
MPMGASHGTGGPSNPRRPTRQRVPGARPARGRDKAPGAARGVARLRLVLRRAVQGNSERTWADRRESGTPPGREGSLKESWLVAGGFRCELTSLGEFS